MVATAGSLTLPYQSKKIWIQNLVVLPRQVGATEPNILKLTF